MNFKHNQNLELHFVIWREKWLIFTLAGSQFTCRKWKYSRFFLWNHKVPFLFSSRNCLTTFLHSTIAMMKKNTKTIHTFFCPYAISLNLQLQFVIWCDFALAGSQHSHRKLNYQLFFSWNCKVQFLLLTQNCLTTFLRLEIGMMTNNSHKKRKNCF